MAMKQLRQAFALGVLLGGSIVGIFCAWYYPAQIIKLRATFQFEENAIVSAAGARYFYDQTQLNQCNQALELDSVKLKEATSDVARVKNQLALDSRQFDADNRVMSMCVKGLKK